MYCVRETCYCSRILITTHSEMLHQKHTYTQICTEGERGRWKEAAEKERGKKGEEINAK